ncbi:MAG: helix-turn-helix domain-containing protein [Eubacterium sp.]
MFGKRLNQTRKELNITAQYMAEHLQISTRGYRMYESGDRSPSLEMLVQIADILNVSTDYLLGRDDFLKSHGVSFDEH